MAINLYALPGSLYETISLGLSLGLAENRVKLPGLRNLKLHGEQTVLDWGCGTGLLLRKIADELKEGTIIAMDRAPGLLRRAKSISLPHFKGDCWFVACDGCKGLCFSEPVDAVIASYTLGVVTPEQCRRAIDNIHAVLRPGGKLLIMDMYWPKSDRLLENAYYKALAYFFNRLFQQDFQGTPLEVAKLKFEELTYVEYPSLMSFSWIGRKA